MTLLKEDAVEWLQHWPDGLIALDTDGRVLWLSAAAQKILGWQTGDFKDGSIHNALCVQAREFDHGPNECPLVCFSSNSASGDKASKTQSAYWLGKNGEFVSVDYRLLPVKNKGATHHLVSFVENQCQQHNFEELTKFAGFVDKNPSAIAEFDAEGQMLFGNPAMQDLLLQHGFDDSGHARIFPEALSDICKKCSVDNKSNTHIEVALESCFYTWHFYPLDDQGEVTIIGYAFDATEMKLAQDKANATRSQVRRDFYAKMIHELRTPLNAIVGYSDLVLCRSSSEMSERDRRALRGIKLGGMQLNELISDTLDISKIEAGKMSVEIEDFSLDAIVQDIHEQMQYLAETKRLTYAVDCEDNLQVVSDRRKVRQILVNLVSNAIKYTKKGKVWVEIFSSADQGVFTLKVSDTGVGIPAEQLASLFQEYQQVRESQNKGIQGTGLGLALVNELIQVLEGSIKVESDYGEGSRFIVQLPLASTLSSASSP